MPRPFSPIRWSVVREVRDFLTNNEMTDATMDTKNFMIFRNRDRFEKGISFKEMCLIHYLNRCYKNSKGELIIPSSVEHEMRQQLNIFRHNMKKYEVILYCMQDKMTGAQLYFNITTEELYKIIEARVDKIIKGIQRNKKKAKEILQMTKEARKKFLKNKAEELRKEALDKLKKEMSRRRREELKKIHEEEERKLREQEEREQNRKDEEGDEEYKDE